MRKVKLLILLIFIVITIGILFGATKEQIKTKETGQIINQQEEKIKDQPQNQLSKMREEIKQLIDLNFHSTSISLIKENNIKISRILDQIIINDLNEKDKLESVGVKLTGLGIGKMLSYKLDDKKFLIVYSLPIAQAGSVRETFLRLFVKDDSKYKLVSTSEEVKRFNTEHYKIKTQTGEIIQSFSEISIYSIEPLSNTEFLTFGRILYWRSVGVWEISDDSLKLTDAKIISDYFAEIKFINGKIYIYYPKDTKIPGKGWINRDNAFIEIYSIKKGLLHFEDKIIGEETELIRIIEE